MSSGNPKDCLGCRLVSGFGILAIGGYVYFQAQKSKRFQKRIIQVIGGGKYLRIIVTFNKTLSFSNGLNRTGETIQHATISKQNTK